MRRRARALVFVATSRDARLRPGVSPHPDSRPGSRQTVENTGNATPSRARRRQSGKRRNGVIDARTTGEMFGVDAGDIDDDEPDAWPEPEQRKLDESVRCAICQELFTMPVSFSTCTHSCASPTRRVSTLEDRDRDHERQSHRPRVTLTGFRAYLSTRSLLVVHPTHAEGVQTRVPSLQSPGEGGGSETQSRARGCRRSVQSGANATAGGRAARRRSDTQSSRRASRARGDDETKQTRGCQQRPGARAGRRSPRKTSHASHFAKHRRGKEQCAYCGNAKGDPIERAGDGRCGGFHVGRRRVGASDSRFPPRSRADAAFRRRHGGRRGRGRQGRGGRC
jgi:hypothetical protein